MEQPQMTRKVFREFIWNILELVDSDVAKQYSEETAEIPEDVEDCWKELETYADKYYVNIIDDE